MYMPRVVVAALMLPLGGVIIATYAFAQDKTRAKTETLERDRVSLRNLPGVYLVVGQLSADLERDGLTTESLRTAAELRLRRAGIRVLTEEQSNGNFLSVEVFELKKSDGEFYAYSINVEFYQPMRLDRDPSLRVMGTTWARRMVGLIGVNKLPQMRDNVSEAVDTFSNDFLAENSPSATTSRPTAGRLSLGGNQRPAQQPKLVRPRPPQPVIHVVDLQEHTVSEIIGRGRYVRLDDGSTWEVDHGEESMVEGWGTVEVVLKVVDVDGTRIYELINTDDDEEVSVTRVR